MKRILAVLAAAWLAGCAQMYLEVPKGTFGAGRIEQQCPYPEFTAPPTVCCSHGCAI